MGTENLEDLPDTIFGIGGAGKELAFNVMEQGWVLNEVMRSKDSATIDLFEAFIVDTATREMEKDIQRVNEIREDIDEREKRFRKELGATITPKIHHENLGDQISNAYNSKNGLLGKNPVTEIARAGGFDHWWVKDSPRHIKEGLDFKEGVIRKRALSKALYYAAKASGEVVDRMISRAGDDIAICVGLGGGTGSGMAIELASDLNERGDMVDVTLFAVLPALDERERKRTNAAAALAELEYLSITEESPFKNVILLPFGPAREDGQNLYDDEFDEAFVNTLISYWNIQSNHEVNEHGPAYGPFTLAVPQILRYNTEAVSKMEDEAAEFLERKERVLEIEGELYDELETFLTDVDEDVAEEYARLEEENSRIRPPDSNLNRSEIQRLKDQRLDTLKQLIELPVFNELDYRSVEAFGELMDNVYDGEQVLDTIDELARQQDLDEPMGSLPTDLDDQDEKVATVLNRDIQMIIRRKRLMELTHLVEDDLIVDNTVNYLIGNGDVQSGHKAVVNELDTVNRSLRTVESDLEAVTEDLESAEETVAERVEEVEREVREDLSQYATLRSERDQIVELAAALDQQLRQVVTVIAEATSEAEVENVELTYDFAEIRKLLADAGIEDHPVDQSAIEDALDTVKIAKKQDLKANEGGLLSRLINPGGDERHRDIYETKYDELKVAEPEYITIPAWNQQQNQDSFSVRIPIEFESHVEDVLDDAEESIVERITDGIEGELAGENGDKAAVDDVERTLRGDESFDSADDLFESIREQIHDALYAQYAAELEERKEELTEEKGDLDSRQDTYEKARRLFERLNDHRDFDDQMEAVNDKLAEVESGVSVVPTDDEDYRYIKQISPENVYEALQSADIADSNVWNPDSVERSRIESNLHKFVQNTITHGNEYLTLNRKSITSPRNDTVREAYYGHTINVHYMSRLFDEDETVKFDRIDSNIKERFYLEDENTRYQTMKHKNGGPWDVGLTFFLGGVFLDNLRTMSEPGSGYFTAYQSRENTLGDDIMVHHAYGLDGSDSGGHGDGTGGFYVRRNKLLNLERDDDLLLLVDNDDDEVVQALFDDGFIDIRSFFNDHPYNNEVLESDR